MKTIKLKNILWQTLKKLSNLSISISLLLIIAIISMIGTIIEQNQSIAYYEKNYPINIESVKLIINWKIILNLGLDHIYSNPFFITILTLFFFSLLTCTLSNQLPALKNARKWKFLQKTKRVNDKAHFTEINQISICNIIYSLHSNNYYIFHKQQNIYGYKGLTGRIAPIFVHFSIILTLIGSLINLLYGFTAQEIIPEGEIFHVKNIIESGFNSKLPNNLIGKINNFSIAYNNNNSIKQFFSNVTLYNNKNQHINQKYIFVNSPLIFNNVTFYQTDWEINSIRLKIGNSQTIQKTILKNTINNQNLWSCQLPINNKSYILLVFTKLNDRIFIYDQLNNFITSVGLQDKIVIDNTTIKIIEIMTKTGLQIKIDPGIFITYSGFLILMVSIMISYMSYSQVWVTATKEFIELAGFTNRATLTFEEDVINIQEIYTNYTWPSNLNI
uniref:Cytochrome c biogenesis protein Ccs1 n=1 Tax=Hydropuntia rangiferina TaxID=338881 RepID=A0A345U843_9FLOR|nr:Cytochrome c biogenesis protein [Hydropuntia rangiferina]AXI96629.1 Cytochrome c biogenesis protein [Hydropuntia rangiferina]UAD87312.1 Cytochrome c biogenesis protein [Hydropuntia rangiferina]